MKTIEEIRAIIQNTIEEREKEFVDVCTKFIEDVIEPKILAEAKKGYERAFVRTNRLNPSQIDYVINIYEEKGYKVKYSAYVDDIEICWK